MSLNKIGWVLIVISALWCVKKTVISNSDFVNIKEITSKYLSIFNQNISDIVFYLFMPCIFGVGVSLVFPASLSIIESISTTVSILLGLLFAVLGALASFRVPDLPEEKTSKIERLIQIQDYNVVFNETIYLILFLALLSVTELLIDLIGIAVLESNYSSIMPVILRKSFKIIGSSLVYCVVFSIFLNCLVIIKRIGRLIAKREENVNLSEFEE